MFKVFLKVQVLYDLNTVWIGNYLPAFQKLACLYIYIQGQAVQEEWIFYCTLEMERITMCLYG